MYEVREFVGEYVITCLGENSHSKREDDKTGYGFDMNDTMSFMPNILMTREEYNKVKQK